MSPSRPRQMPFTESLGMKLLALEQGVIDAIATLRSNLAATRKSMDNNSANAFLVAQGFRVDSTGEF